MAAKMMPGGPVADAVFADLVPRSEKLIANGHTPGLGTILVGDDGASARYVGMKMEKARGARVVGAAPAPARRRDAGRRARRGARVQRRPARRRLPHPAPHAAADRLRRRAAGDGSRQGRRRHAPGEHGPPRADDAGAGAGDARGHRGAARVLRDPGRRARGVHPRPRHHARSSARAAALAEARRPPTPRSPWCTPASPTGPSTRRGPASSSPPRACPASCSPSTSRPGAVVVGGGVRYEGRKLLPDVDEACEEVAGAITPRVGGVGPTTIAMLFRNAIEAAERNVRRPAPEPARSDARMSRARPAAGPAAADGVPALRRAGRADRRRAAVTAT